MSSYSSTLRCRILSSIARHKITVTRRPLSSSSSTVNDPKESVLAAQSSDPPSSSSAADPPPSDSTKSSALRFLKYGVVAALTGITSFAGYATYAYTVEEVDEKTKGFRALANHNVKGDASALDKFQGVLYSSAITVPAKAVEVYLDLRRTIEEHVKGFTEPASEKLLPDLHPMEQHVFTLVLDLNETLVHSDWTRERGWRTFKRPGVDDFLEHLAKFYEIVVFSDETNMYVDPVIDRLDQKGCIRYRLSRSATKYQDGKHYRDLSKLNRDPRKILYVSGHALENSLQPENCVPIKPWKLESDDTALVDLIPFLEFVARNSPADIRTVLASYQGRDVGKEFIERSKEYHKRMQEKKQQGGFWRR